MSLKKIFITAFPVAWLLFFVADLAARMTAGPRVFRKMQPFIAAGRGIRKVKRLCAFALILMNVFLAWRWIGSSKGCCGPKAG
jgi:hypothetical protein